jgi:hypothetical protein
MAEFLATGMGATRTAKDLASYGYDVHIDGKLVHLFENENEHHVSIFMERGEDTRLVATIAERFDAALATGKYDAMFATKPAP